MGNADTRPGHELAHPRGAFLNVVHAVVQVVYLPAAGQLLADGLGHDALVVLEHIGFNRLALKRRLLNCAHIADARQRHVQRAGDRRGRQRQHIDADEALFELFLVLDAEPLLLVDDDKAQVLEFYIAGQQPVRADYNVHGAVLQPAQRLLLLLGGAVAGQKPDADGEGLHAGQRGVEVLPRQNRRGGQDRALFAAHHAFERGAQCDLGLADADVTAEQPVHRPRLLHIVLDVCRAGQLVGRFLIGKALFKITLPGVVGGEGVAVRLLAAGVQLDQLLRHLLRRSLDLLAGLGPIAAAQAAQLHVVAVARRSVAGQKVQLGDGHVQHVLFVVLDAQVVLCDALHGHPLDARVPPDAVVLVNDQIAHRDFAQAVQRVLIALFLLLCAAHAEGAGRKHGVFRKRQAAPGGKLPRQDLHQPGARLRRRVRRDVQPFGAQVGGQTCRCTRRAGHDCDRRAAAAKRLDVLQQRRDLAAPGGQRVGGCVDDGFQRHIGHAAGKVLGAERAVRGALRPGPAALGVELIQPCRQHAVLQQGGKLLAPAERGGALGLPQGGRLLQDQQRIVKVV